MTDKRGVSEAVDTEPEWSKWPTVPHIGAWGWAYNQGAQGVVSAVPEPELTMRKVEKSVSVQRAKEGVGITQ